MLQTGTKGTHYAGYYKSCILTPDSRMCQMCRQWDCRTHLYKQPENKRKHSRGWAEMCGRREMIYADVYVRYGRSSDCSVFWYPPNPLAKAGWVRLVGERKHNLLKIKPRDQEVMGQYVSLSSLPSFCLSHPFRDSRLTGNKCEINIFVN